MYLKFMDEDETLLISINVKNHIFYHEIVLNFKYYKVNFIYY